MARPDEEQKRREEAARALRNVERDSETLGTSSFIRAAKHFTAADADQEDPVEVWGKRVGRLLALAVFVVLLIWLVNFLTRP
ncbi:MAG: hypothetical protein AAFP99_03155 [Pseudomonadota bacterium]